ncbi:MAG TPA: shikimate dehydrogenase [Candidatus Omnitrophota bacterium]|nr:shikimate dehydrogenase [Candidatus Omnitrophota bacterium]
MIEMGEKKVKKKAYGLLGCKISYSLSPVMHNAAFRHFGAEADYSLFDIELPDVRGFMDRLTSGFFSGINVTVPYKVTVKDIMLENPGNRLDEFASRLGAVNTVRRRGKYLEGFNTDGPGFAESLRDDLKLVPEKLAGKKVLLLGSGGAGRAVSFYLLGSNFKPALVSVYDTDSAKAEDLVSSLASVYGKDRVKRLRGDEETSAEAKESALVVNATPLGTKDGDQMPLPGGYPGGSACLYDLVYARETELVRSWREAGSIASGGLGMLVNQAALAFEIWTDGEYRLDDIKSVMRASLPDEMRRRYGWNTF